MTVLLIKAMSVKDAKGLAQHTMQDFETAAHADPFLNVPDDAAKAMAEASGATGQGQRWTAPQS